MEQRPNATRRLLFASCFFCSQTYRFDLQGDRLTLFDPTHEERRAAYTRMGAISTELPPTLIPPMPSATPPAE